MTRYGDPVVCIIPAATLLEMPTAILANQTPRGFFLAADGRSRREDGGEWTVFSDEEQKIFPICDDRASFGFAVNGFSRFTPDNDESDIILDFYTAIRQASEELRTDLFPGAMDYCARLAEDINRNLGRSVTDAQRAGKSFTYPDNSADQFPGGIAWVILCGFYMGLPHGAIFRFSHRNQQLMNPSVIQMIGMSTTVLLAPPVAWRLCERDDAKFLRFRTSPGDFTFEESAAIAEEYVAFCGTARALAADRFAAGVGGRVHAASVTAADGFKWIPGFEPIPPGPAIPLHTRRL